MGCASVKIGGCLAALLGWLIFSTPVTAAENAVEDNFKNGSGTFSEYGLSLEPVTLKISGLKRTYTFIWISDLHVIAEDLSGILPESRKAIGRRRDTRFNNPQSGKKPSELWSVVPELVNNSTADALFLGGDICDIGTAANLKLLKHGIHSIKKPVIFLREDHDFSSTHRHLAQKDGIIQQQISKEIDGHPALPVIEYDDLLVVGLDNSRFAIKPEIFEQFKALYAKGKPIILLMHVPIMPSDPAIWDWMSDKTGAWGSRRKKLRGKMTDFIKMVTAPGSPVKLVLCGHTHRMWDGMLAPGVRQHIFSPAFQGRIGLVKIVPGR